jgi:MFS family permease
MNKMKIPALIGINLGILVGLGLGHKYSRLFHYLISLPPSTWVAILLALGIGWIEIVSAHWIREEETYHPAYKVEKRVWGAVFAGSGINLLLGPSSFGIFFRIFTNTLIIGAAILAFFFIRYRRDNPLFRVTRLRTQMGIKISGSLKENNTKASEVAALIRHDLSGGGESKLISEWALEEIRAAMGSPPKDKWVGEEREELERRREARSNAGEIVDVPEKEI